MGKLTVVEWISLDGVYDTELFGNWFFPFDSLERQQYIRNATLASTAILYGRKTYDELSSYWPHNTEPELAEITRKLNDTPKFVVSKTLVHTLWQNTSIISGDITQQIGQLKMLPNQDIHVYGSATLVKSLAAAGLIDELQLLVHPVIVGKGKRFFLEDMGLTGLQPLSVTTLEKGVVLMTYSFGKA